MADHHQPDVHVPGIGKLVSRIWLHETIANA
jgi:hypothetical protein